MNKKLQAQRIEKITAKIHAFVWVLLAVLLAYFTDLPSLVVSDRINRCVSLHCISHTTDILIEHN